MNPDPLKRFSNIREPVTIPTAAAVANAVYHAVGIRVTASPINPLQLVSLLEQQKKES